MKPSIPVIHVVIFLFLTTSLIRSKEVKSGGFGSRILNEFSKSESIHDPIPRKRRSSLNDWHLLGRRGLADVNLDSLDQKTSWDTSMRTGVNNDPLYKIYEVPREESYTYNFMSQDFRLNGSAVINYVGTGKYWIEFNFSISGEGNASAEPVVPEANINLPDWSTGQNINVNPVYRPNSCHLQNTSNLTKWINCPRRPRRMSTTQTPLTTLPLRTIQRTVGRYPSNKWDANNNKPYAKVRGGRRHMFPTLKPEHVSYQQRSLGGNSFSRIVKRSISKNRCSEKVVTHTRRWLCIRPSSQPCFLVLLQGTKYKVAEKICPHPAVFSSPAT